MWYEHLLFNPSQIVLSQFYATIAAPGTALYCCKTIQGSNFNTADSRTHQQHRLQHNLQQRRRGTAWGTEKRIHQLEALLVLQGDRVYMRIEIKTMLIVFSQHHSLGIIQAIALIMPGSVEECAVETNPKTLSFTCVFPFNQSWDAGICWAGYN